jgi:quercetin 2,3-dioxygenase
VSNLETSPVEQLCGGEEATAATFELMHGRQVQLTPRNGTSVVRTLPNRERRMVGAWCFLDQYGPTVIADGGPGMSVAAHPHTGLQTVSWLVAGEIHHYDSLGNSQLIRPGQLNLMTAGRGIAHAELSPVPNSGVLHGAQLWVALPAEHAAVAPHFEHHPDLPVIAGRGVTVTVIVGSLDGATSGAKAYSPLLGAEIALESEVKLPLRKEFEHAVLVLSGSVDIGLKTLEQGPLLYLGRGREQIKLMAREPSRLLLLGGEPFGEQIVMWWNFVGRSHEEIVAFRDEWEAQRFPPVTGGYASEREAERFPPVTGGYAGEREAERFAPVTGGYAGETLPAPPLPTTRLKPRGRMR